MSDLPSYANFTQALHKDTSICEHLRTYLSPSIKSDGDVKVKTEEGVSQAEVVDHEKKVATALKRFCEVASWGAVAEGAGTKRRKVSCSSGSFKPFHSSYPGLPAFLRKLQTDPYETLGLFDFTLHRLFPFTRTFQLQQNLFFTSLVIFDIRFIAQLWLAFRPFSRSWW